MLEVLDRSRGTLYGMAGGIWVMILHDRPTAADMSLARPTLETAAARAPGGFPTLTWIMQQAGIMMDNDARKIASEITTEFAREIRAQATVIERDGFQGATVRAIVAGMDAMARSASPKRVFATIGPAVEWCSQYRPRSETALGSPELITKSLSDVYASLVRKA